MKLFYSLAVVLCLISGCATQITSIVDGKTTISKDHGFLLLNIESNIDLKEIFLYGTEFISLTGKDIQAGSNYILVDLKAGEYTFTKIRLDNNWYINLEEEHWTVDINKGQVNYVGHLELVRARHSGRVSKVELVNRSSEALEYLENSYPSILAQHSVNFSGFGEDDFFTLASSMKKD